MPVPVNKVERCNTILNSALDRIQVKTRKLSKCLCEAVDEDVLVCKVTIQLISQGYDAVPEWYSYDSDVSIKGPRPDIIIDSKIAVEVKYTRRGVYGYSCFATGIGQCIRYLRQYEEVWFIIDTERFYEEMAWMKTILPKIRFWIITNNTLQEVQAKQINNKI